MTRWSLALLSFALCAACGAEIDPEDNDSSVFDRTGVSSLERKDLLVGNGLEAERGDTITAHYVLRYPDGRLIENSYQNQKPITRPLKRGSLIDGWVLGVAGMREGGKRRLRVPSRLAYGENRMGGIPPNSDLVFEIELLRVQKSSK